MNYNSRDYQYWLNATGNHLNNIAVYVGGARSLLNRLRR